MEPLFRIVFSGERVPGRPVQQIVETFSERFKVREDRARELVLTTQRLVLKQDLDRQRAERYRDALIETGLLVAMESQDAVPGFIVELDEPSPPPLVVAPPEPEADGDGGTFYSELLANDTYYDELPVIDAFADDPHPGRSAAPSLAKGPTSDPRRCPKCDALRVSLDTGVCQACGVVVERYLARLAANGGDRPGDDPYAPPRADLTLPAPRGGSAAPGRPRAVRAGRGWGWIADAWPLFRDQPLHWIGAFLAFAAISIALSFVPFIGGLLSALLGPAFTGGFAIGAQTQYSGGRFEVNHLFAGFTRNPKGLLLLGAVYMGLALVLGLVMGLGVALVFALSGGFAVVAGTPGADPSMLGQMGTLMLLPVLFALLISVPAVMAIFFAPYLVALNDVPVLRALQQSFQGCWRNVLPFLVFSLAALGLSLASLFTLGLALVVIAPVLTIAMYLAYREIYYGAER